MQFKLYIFFIENVQIIYGISLHFCKRYILKNI